MWQSRSVALVAFFVCGLLVGSFLNVCISRIPEGESVVLPGSHCPRCKAPIRPYDNIPVLSWLILRGKCRNCALPISPMYPAVELLTGIAFAGCYAAFGMTVATFKWVLFACLLIILTVTDLRIRILPDAVNWPGLGMGLVFSAVAPPRDGAALWLVQQFSSHPVRELFVGILDGLLGAAFGSLLLWAVGYAYRVVRGREGMGFGDVKMMAMVGAFLGLRGTFLTILFGTLLGSVVGLGLIGILYASGWKNKVAERASRRGLGPVPQLRWTLASQYQLPLGTFLGIAAMAVVFALNAYFPAAGPYGR